MKIQTLAFALPTICRSKPLFAIAFLAIGMTVFGPQTTEAQDTPKAAPEPQLVRIYDVEDLVSSGANQPFNGFSLPGLATEVLPQRPRGGGFGGGAGGGMGGGGGGFGGGGGAGGGGVFNIPPTVTPQFGVGGGGPSNVRVMPRFEDLEYLIENTIARSTWSSSGGEGHMSLFGDTLVITQTETVHDQIKTLLAMLRDVTAAKHRTINIKAIWLTIDETQLQQLVPKSNQVVDKDTLKKLVGEHGRRAQITCFNTQTVHVASGNLKSSVESVVPVVGQHKLDSQEPTQVAQAQPKKPKLPKHIMAQFFDATPAQDGDLAGKGIAEQRVGYSPVARWINYGSLLQITPIIKSETEIEIDLASIVISPGSKATGFKLGTTTVDRHDMHVQQFRSSCRLDAGMPTLVGGSTFGPKNDGELQTYLIIEATPVTAAKGN